MSSVLRSGFCVTLKKSDSLSLLINCIVIPEEYISGKGKILSIAGSDRRMRYFLLLYGVKMKLPIPAWMLLNSTKGVVSSYNVPFMSTGSPLMFTALNASLLCTPETKFPLSGKVINCMDLGFPGLEMTLDSFQEVISVTTFILLTA